MDIERLKELADCDVFIGGNPIVVDRAQETLRTLIDEAIARQSVKSEDVAEAMKQVKGELDWYALMSPNTALSVDDIRRRKNARTIITALQAYQPNPISEDVAISKTETASEEVEE